MSQTVRTADGALDPHRSTNNGDGTPPPNLRPVPFSRRYAMQWGPEAGRDGGGEGGRDLEEWAVTSADSARRRPGFVRASSHRLPEAGRCVAMACSVRGDRGVIACIGTCRRRNRLSSEPTGPTSPEAQSVPVGCKGWLPSSQADPSHEGDSSPRQLHRRAHAQPRGWECAS